MRIGYSTTHDVLTPEQCKRLVELGSKDLAKSDIIKERPKVNTLRKSRNSWFNNGCEGSEILEIAVARMSEVSFHALNYSLSLIEPIQFTSYEKGDYYGWHYDQWGISPPQDKPDRIVSASIELCDPDSYGGGGLEFFKLGGEPVPDVKLGSMVVFPSFLPHQAREVTSGRRCSLVLWGR